MRRCSGGVPDRNLSVDYSWSIAIIAGVITQLVVIFIGDFYFNLPVAIVP